MKKLSIFIFVLLSITKAHSRIYVDSSATGLNNGTSWIDAFTKLQDAIAQATAGDTIWVAKGTYYPDEGGGNSNNNRSASFYPKKNVPIYGGFSGIETAIAQRNLTANATKLSGNINPAVANSNAYCAVTIINTDSTLIDGVYITDAYNELFDYYFGAGIRIDNSKNCSLNNVNICNNRVYVNSLNAYLNRVSAGVFVSNSDLAITSSNIYNNSVFQAYTDGSTALGTFVAGGILVVGAELTLKNTVVAANHINLNLYDGSTAGGIYVSGSTPACELDNCLIVANTAQTSAITVSSTAAGLWGKFTLTNSTIAFNQNTANGGAGLP